MNFKIGKSFVVAVLLMTCSSTASKMERRCSKTSPISGTVQMTESKEVNVSTVIYTPLQKGQTFCYDLMVEEDGKVKSGKKVFISLMEVEQHYEVKFGYNFSIPTMKVDCLCDCPGFTDSCNHEHEGESCKRESGPGTGDCAKKYSNGHNDGGCTLNEPAEACCDIKVYNKNTTPEYTAVYVGNPVTWYTLEVGFMTDSRDLISKFTSKTFNSGTMEVVTDVGVVGIVGQAVEKQPLRSGWYFIKNSDKKLLTGEPINELNENSITKLGWYKLNSEGKLLNLDWNALRNSVSIRVWHCDRDDITWQSSARFYQIQGYSSTPIGHTVDEVFNIKVELKNDNRAASVQAPTTVPVLVHTRINASAKVVFRYDTSSMKAFEAEIVHDQFGNRNLVLFLKKASGSFHGTLELENSLEESFNVLVASAEPIDTTKKVRVLSKHKCPSKVCLFTENKKYFTQCVSATCREEKLVGAVHPDYMFYPSGGKPSNSEKGILDQILDKMIAIKDWIFGGIQEFVVLIGAVIACIVIFIIVCCCLKNCSCCCNSHCCSLKCAKKRKQKRRNGGRMNHDDRDEVDCQETKEEHDKHGSSYVVLVGEEKNQEGKPKDIDDRNEDSGSLHKLSVREGTLDENGGIIIGGKSDDCADSLSVQVVDKEIDDVYTMLTIGAYLDLPGIDENFSEV